MLAKQFQVSPNEVRFWPEDRLALWLAFSRGEGQRRDEQTAQTRDTSTTTTR